MKKIDELTEQEIYALTDEEIDIMIRLRKAEEGIKLVNRPKEPSYFPIEQPDMIVYGCKLFENDVVFTNPEDIQKVISLIRGIDKKFRVDYDYGKTEGDIKYATSKLSKYYHTDDEIFNISTQSVYSVESYNRVVDLATQNKKTRTAYEKELKEYEKAIQDSKWVEDEIKDKVNTVREKMWSLENLCRRFRFDYLPIAQENETIAMGFLDKAYSLTDDQKEYVLANYKNVA